MRFSDFGKRVVFAAFDGGEITSDADVLLLREQARRIRLFERMADCFSDRRDPTRTVHTPQLAKTHRHSDPTNRSQTQRHKMAS